MEIRRPIVSLITVLMLAGGGALTACSDPSGSRTGTPADSASNTSGSSSPDESGNNSDPENNDNGDTPAN